MNIEKHHNLPVMCIGIMTYNHSLFVEEALQSAILQDYVGKYYILVSDDGSKDDTFAKIQNFIKKNPNYNWIINQTNGGCGVSGNERQCYELMPNDADVLVINEGDDVSTPNRLSVLATYLLQYPEVLLIGSHVHFIKGGAYIEMQQDKTPMLYGINDAHKEVSLWGCTRVYRRRLVEAYGIISSDVTLTDVIWNLRARMLNSMLIIPECLLYYRLHENQLTNAVNNKKIDRWPIFVQMHKDVYKAQIKCHSLCRILMHVDHYGIAAFLNNFTIWHWLRKRWKK